MTSKLKILLVHGIGNPQPGWSHADALAKELGIPEALLEEIRYEDIFDGSWKRQLISKLVVSAAVAAASAWVSPALAAGLSTPSKLLEDSVGDVLHYFLSKKARTDIQQRVLAAIENTLLSVDTVIVVGYSLGSIVCYEVLSRERQLEKRCQFISTASPLGSPVLSWLVRRFLKKPASLLAGAKLVTDWINVYSPLDPLSGHIKGLPFSPDEEVKCLAQHQEFAHYLAPMAGYLKAQVGS